MFDCSSGGPGPALDSALARGRAEALRRIVAELDALRAPAEPAFMAIGAALVSSLEVLNRLDNDFEGLAGRLESEDSANAMTSLGGAVGQCARLAEEASRSLALLRELEQTATGADRPLALLGRIVGEIGALAINAKIQAAQVNAADIDFSVFTTEIARLGALAGQAVSTAAERLAGLRVSILSAASAEEAFQRTDVRELGEVRGRLADCLAALADRRRRAREAAAAVSQKARQIAGRTSACIGALQINDMTSQRIEHVRQALDLLCGILDARGAVAGCEWTSDLDGERKLALVASVCRLQGQQLDRAVADFVREVDKVKTNLSGLARDAEEVLAQARGALGGDADDGSFVRELKDNVARASALLASYAEAEERIQAVITSVSDGFSAMTRDLDAIHSVDADLRVMGLNASFKCGRLGSSGRALGVVAQELRGCSRRTEETTETISRTIAAAVEVSRRLTDGSRDDHDGAAALAAAMGNSVAALNSLGDDLDGALARLRDQCGSTATLLAGTAAGVTIDRDLRTAAARSTKALTDLADAIPVAASVAEGIHEDVRRLLEQHYTMASERVIHALFAEGGSEAEAEAEATQAEVDDCFF